MFKKSFISIYFLPNKLLIIEISSNRKKIIRHATVDLPEGIIKDYKVSDIESLSKVLKNIWSKFHFKEKSLGLILPEFSTFMKLFKLPNISLSELNEAVNWQAQEFLPEKMSELVMDWKIVDKKPDGYEVLVVALKKQLLLGYVQSAEKAGLFPLIVEIPSVGLSRLLVKDQNVTLIINVSYQESVIVLSQNEKIIGTSVVRSGNEDEIIKSVSRMIKHYKDAKPTRIFCGGLSSEEFMQKIKGAHDLPVEKLSLNIRGLEEAKIQEYLIPISILTSDPSEPSDPKSLNLLPINLVEKYKSEKLRLQTWSLTLTITLFVWISFFVVLGFYLFLFQQINLQKSENLKIRNVTNQRQSAKSDVTEINLITEKVLKVKNEFILPQVILNKINSSKSQDITLNDWDLDLEKGIVKIAGISSDRNALIEFKRNLEKNSEFTEVSIPISSFEGETNLEFSISFIYLKPGSKPQNTKGN